MGYDIYPIAQVKEHGEWITNPLPIFPIWEEGKFELHPSNNRFLDWFKVLANFKNDDDFPFMTNPRGLPDDAALEQEHARAMSDFQTKSWVNLKDFDNFDWNQVHVKSGVITLSQYVKIKDSATAPLMHGGDCTGVILTMEEADIYLYGPVDYSKLLFVKYYWPVSLRELFKKQLETWEFPLRELTVLFGEARIVFAFKD